MATAPTPTPTPAPKRIQTVYGFMHDPLTGEDYTQEPKPYVKPTSWVQAQLDSGKMKLV